ncbi:MAG: enoyl-CoA hydratase/isomerase family protein [bacterium]|nr:enoyl-CoA hydratase/isomerase family protein [bacterium]
MSSPETLVTRVDRDGVCTLSLNRPEALNALSLGVFRELEAHASALADQTDEIGCVVLRGEGRSFSAGNDIKSLQAGEQDPHVHYRTDVIDQLEKLPQPAIASVRGHCYTGALELALVCDLMVVSETARLRDTHAGWGMVPMWGMTARLPQRIGVQRAKELMFTGRTLTGKEAVEWGLANVCVTDETLEAASEEMARGIVAQSWHSLREEKALVGAAARMTYAEGLEWERKHSRGTTPDLFERLAKFGKRD